MTSPSTQQTYFIAVGGDRYEPTEHAGGTWREDELHLAPVAGLLVHHLERWRIENKRDSLEFGRISIEVLGQIARAQLAFTTEVVRPGRTIELIETTAVIGGRTTIRARAWLLQRSDTREIEADDFETMPPPEQCPSMSMSDDWLGAFIDSIQARAAEGRRRGRARAWLTSELDLVAGEPSQPLAEFAKMLDAANGVAARVDPTEWMFPNVDLTLHFFRRPTGRWVGFDTRVAFGGDGLGLTSSVLHDLGGPVGTIQQSLTLRKL